MLGGAEQGLLLFRRISHTKNGFSLRKQRLSYTRALEMVRKLLKSVGLKPELYGLHSMRSGGCIFGSSTWFARSLDYVSWRLEVRVLQK